MNYEDEHGLLVEEYLIRGTEVKSELLKKFSVLEDFERELPKYLGYVYARIPTEIWDKTSVRVDLQRQVARNITTYIEKSVDIRRKGLGLTILGDYSSYKTYNLYIVAKCLVDKGFTVFTLTLDEFLFFLRETRDSKILKNELLSRIKEPDFVFLLDVPEQIEMNTTSQDLLALLSLRLSRSLPVIFTVNSNYTDIQSIPIVTLLGRLLLPFMRVNKLIIITDPEGINLGNIVEEKWGGLSV